MKSWLALYKYRGQERLSGVLGPMLMHALQLHRADGKRESTEYITFVPLSRERFDERGFNQAEQLAIELGKRAQIPVLPLFKRNRHTNKQSLKARAERVEDMRGVFRLKPAGMEGIQRLLRQHSRIKLYIVDDVYTTGSTLNECARVVKEHFPAIDVYGLNWAR
ncbi:ComF family protein [Paenibacillus silviterrae]|uniref:ComF family protein n=1 Tax=Paenibacillus silviterrae TaxID=3242194 RepID=UPI0025436E2B|nr:hypothetical protein [Paenibacillus chinjuensis]